MALVKQQASRKPRRQTMKDIPEQERPRERLLSRGEQWLTDAELLAVVLSSGTREESALQLARRILAAAGGLKQLAAMSVVELQHKFHGIGPARSAQLKAALELARRYVGQASIRSASLSNSGAVFEAFRSSFCGKQQEEFWVLALDARNRLIVASRVSSGTLMGSLVHPREVYQVAIRNSAAGLIILHNHPSGDPEPSPEDRRVTQQIAQAGKLLGIPLLDHLVIGDTQYFSFKDSGLL